jgi:glycosyltransferase involved in cell wall biosynthesis
LAAWEEANLLSEATAHKRGAAWSWRARWEGRLRSLRKIGKDHVSPELRAEKQGQGLIVPEFFSPAVTAALPALFAVAEGPRIAVFHDAIALQFPELSPPKTVARSPAYLMELARFDGVAAVSETSRQALLGYWSFAGLRDTPPVVAIPLGVDPPPPRGTASGGGRLSPLGGPVVLSVGSIEGRKNHAALLEACEQLWAWGARFSLRLVGLAQRETAGATLARIAALAAAGRPLAHEGPVDEATLAAAYQECHFTVYPSLAEGFGLPVLESLARGKPCVCHGGGALGESARGGGCLALPAVDAGALAAAIGRLLAEPGLHASLVREAGRRSFRSWADYAEDISAWMAGLPRR